MSVKIALVIAILAVVSQATLESQTFQQYLQKFGKSYSGDELVKREKVFQMNLDDIISHNKQGHSWTKGVNKFTDMTEEEVQTYFGYNKILHKSSRASSTPKSFKATALPASVDWRLKGVVTPVKNQLKCGSCWAFATAETIESHYAIKTGLIYTLAPQQMVDCTPNPNHCGGTGGCSGATAEVAMDYVTAAGGLTEERFYPYQAVNGTCRDSTVEKPFAIHGYVKVLENDYESVISALANIGPLAIAIDASAFKDYAGGIFDGCPFDKNIDINHAVQLVGYGTDAGRDYWTVRNSWGPTWGEGGYIRVARRVPTATGDFCGFDNTPSDGSGCTGGAPVVAVCGTCGILFDTAFPLV